MNNPGKNLAIDEISKKESLITDVADHIWEYAELSLKEFKSYEYYVKVLKEEGFEVTEKFCGIPTAFAASFGSGSPRIGILGEYDALSGLSQEKGILTAKEINPGGNGHGCGHNLLGAGSLAAALGLKAYLSQPEMEGKGTVIFYGCPGEEGWASKAFMAREKVFESLDAALSWHPGDTNEVQTGSTNSCLQHLYKFSGIASHASGSPEKGRSALDAVELMNIGVQFLREHMSNKARIHYALIDNGGKSPNVVQAKASVLYYVRENHITDCMKLQERVDKIAEGAALMTDTTCEKIFVDGLADTITNHVLEKVMYDNFAELGVPSYTPEEIEYTNSLARTYNGFPAEGSGESYDPADIPGLGSDVDEDYAQTAAELCRKAGHAMNDFLLPLFTGTVFRAGSTDVGDVSWECPTAQIYVASWPNGQAGHSWQNVACGGTSVGHKAAVHAGKVMAATAIDLFENAEILKKAKEEFLRRTKDGYICPFPPEAKAEIVDL